jgi:hypothetical protein
MIKFSFSTKVFAGLGTMVAVAVAFGTALSWDVQQLNYEIEHIKEDVVDPSFAALKAQKDLYRRNTYFLRHLNTTDPKTQAEQEEQIKEATDNIIALLDDLSKKNTEITAPYAEKFKEGIAKIEASKKQYELLLGFSSNGKKDEARARPLKCEPTWMPSVRFFLDSSKLQKRK